MQACIHDKQCFYGVCLRVAQACSSPKVQRCLADVAEQTECQCKLATGILLSASAVGTPVQACTDVAYALNIHLRTKTHRNVRLAQFLLPRPLQACRDLRGSRKNSIRQHLREKGQSKRTCLPLYLRLAAAPAPGSFHKLSLSVARLRWQNSAVEKIVAPETSVAGSASCGKAGGQRFGRYFRLPHCFQAHCAGDLASAGPWHSSRVPTAFPCPWPGGERLRCRVPWGTCT
jgi:hypothetical protein